MHAAAFLVCPVVWTFSALPLAELPLAAQPQRPEVIERPLADIFRRCQKMLELQQAVYRGSVNLNKLIQGSAAKKPRPQDVRAALKLSSDQKESVALANQAIAVLEAQGTAVAFTEVFHALRDDMRRLQGRLARGDVGATTQALEIDIIETLQEMLDALKKPG